MNPNDAATIANFLADNFAYEMQTTERVINAVPNDHLDYRPDEKSKTALGLIRHIVLEDEWLLNSIANGAFTSPPDQSDACGIMNPAEAIAKHRTALSKFLSVGTKGENSRNSSVHKDESSSK